MTTSMLGSLGVIVGAAACGVAASYIMWRATSRSGLWSLIAGTVLGLVAFGFALLIALLITRAWFQDQRF